MRSLIFALATLLSTGCIFDNNPPPDAGPPFDAGPTGPANVPLNEVVATFNIVQSTGGADGTDGQTASVTATFSTETGVPVVFQGQQSVAIGPAEGTLVTLTGPTSANAYTATVPSSPTYQIKVDEPSKGVVTSMVDAPQTITFKEPAANATASLSGFELAWTPTDPASVVTLVLSQTGSSPGQTTKQLTSDPGMYTFTTDDLAPFAQGTPLKIALTVDKTITGGVQLFASSSVTIQQATSESVNPGP